MGMADTFEYKYQESIVEQTMALDIEVITEWLNDLGKQGWQLISQPSYCDNGNDTITHGAWFMRVKETV